MLKTEDQEIDGVRCTVVEFPAMYNFKLLAKLAKTLGPSLAALGQLNPNTDLSDAGPALRDALAGLDPDEAQRLLVELLKSTSVISTEGKRVELSSQSAIDNMFSGRLLTMLKVAMFAVRVNFADFIDGSKKLAASSPLLAKAAAVSAT